MKHIGNLVINLSNPLLKVGCRLKDSGAQAAAGSDRRSGCPRACGCFPPSPARDHASRARMRTVGGPWRRAWGASRDSRSSSLEAACPSLLLLLTRSTLLSASCECAGLSGRTYIAAGRRSSPPPPIAALQVRREARWTHGACTLRQNHCTHHQAQLWLELRLLRTGASAEAPLGSWALDSARASFGGLMRGNTWAPQPCMVAPHGAQFKTERRASALWRLAA